MQNQTKTQNTQLLKLYTILLKKILSKQHQVFQKLKINNITKGLTTKIKKINRGNPNNNYNSILSHNTNTNSNYDTFRSNQSNNTGVQLARRYATNQFKPLESLYSSIKIINGDRHNLNIQKSNRNQIKLQKVQSVPINKQMFLQNWMIRTEKQTFIMIQNYPKSQLSYQKISSYNRKALDCIQTSKFQDFAKQILRKKTSWGKQINTMTYKRQVISSSLTILLPQYQQYAIQLFQMVLRYGGQIEVAFPNYFYAAEIVNFALNLPIQQLRQQLFFQVIKQMNGCAQTYLKLLVLICCLVKPSLRLYIPLLNYIKEQCENYPKFQQYYSFAFFGLIKNFDQPRVQGCTIYQANLLMNLRQIPVIVSMPTSKIFFVQFYISTTDFINDMIQFFDLDENIKYLILFETCLFQEGKLMDNFYKANSKSDQKKIYHQFKGIKIIIVLKNMLDLNKSVKAFNIMYNYFAHQYLKNYYYLPKDQVFELAALKLMSQLQSEQHGHIEIQQLLPTRFFQIYSPSNYKELAQLIVKKYLSLKQAKPRTKIQARKDILRIIKKRQNFMSHFFKGSIYFSDQQSQYDVIIGIKPTKMLLVDFETGRYIKKIPYNKIVKWGSSKSEMCLIVQPFGKVHIQSPQINLIVDIFNTYLQQIIKYVVIQSE